MNRVDKLKSLTASIIHPTRSRDIRITAAVHYDPLLRDLETLPHQEMADLTHTFGTQLPLLLQIAADTSTPDRLREIILEDTVGKTIEHLAVSASIQEEAMFNSSEQRGTFAYATSSVQQAVAESVNLGDALYTLEEMSRIVGDHEKVLNAAKRLHGQIETACVQYFPDARKSYRALSGPPLTPPPIRGLGSNLC